MYYVESWTLAALKEIIHLVASVAADCFCLEGDAGNRILPFAGVVAFS